MRKSVVYAVSDSFKKALEQSADALTAQDLEDLYGCVDDEIIVEIAKKYSIKAPADIDKTTRKNCVRIHLHL